MLNSTRIRNNFSSAASTYTAEAALQRHVLDGLLTLAPPCLLPGMHILDIGCGTGALFRHEVARARQWRITGVDAAFGMCHEARTPAFPVICADAAALPFAPSRFDAAAASLSLHWSADLPRALAETYRTLKPGGTLMLATLCERTLWELRESFADVDTHAHTLPYHPISHWLSALDTAGFSITNQQSEEYREYFPDLPSLFRRFTALGVRYSAGKRGLMTPRRLRTLDKSYQAFTTPKGLPVTWDILYLTAVTQ